MLENRGDEEYQRFLKSLPHIYSAAADILTQETKIAISSIVISEIGDTPTAAEYIESFKIDAVTDQLRFISFSSPSEKIRALEVGVRSYSMKATMLRPGSKGVKMSKAGNLYRTVPLTRDVTSSSSGETGSDVEQAARAEIRDILSAAHFSIKAALTSKATGEYAVLDRAFGLNRKRVFRSKEAYQNKEPARVTEVISFRTMTNKPGSALWQQPTREGKEILSKIMTWQRANQTRIFEEAVDSLLSLLFGD